MKQVFEKFKNPEVVQTVVERIYKLPPPTTKKLRFMHVCGTHENAVGQFGLRALLPSWLKIIAGPGCPVCICPPQDIDFAVKLGMNKNVIVAIYGDMLMVPAKISLLQAKANGGDIRVVYSITDAVDLAVENPQKEVCFFAVGFETTACTIASAILFEPPKNFSILTSHRLIPPALEALLSIEDIDLCGYLLPGHVSTVIGLDAYKNLHEKHNVAMAVAGFEPVDILYGLFSLASQVIEGKYKLFNAYPRAVKKEGNKKAKDVMEKVFRVTDGHWRGIGKIPFSAYNLKEEFSLYDAREKFEIKTDPELQDLNPQCSCHLIMLGKIEPPQCPLFGNVCTPENPYGPCMVSSEGTCKSYYKFSAIK